MLRRALICLFALLPFAAARADSGPAPAEIKIGHLHASSGAYASISMPVYTALKMWVDQTNASGGAFVKAYNKKIPLKLISYDDQSSTATAATLYNQLITQDKVDMLVSDSGSVLTSVAVPIAKEHKMFLFDPTGTGAPFFVDNPYIALIADPVSTIWPKYIADFLNDDGVKAGIKRVAILYSTNDFTGTQANAVRGFIKNAGKLDIVYDQGVPTNTSNYTVLINNIAAANPDAVITLGYTGNDIAFLRNLQDSGQKFRFLFSIYPGIETATLLKNVGADGLNGLFTYVTSAAYEYKPEVGMNLEQFREAFEKVGPASGVEFGFNAIAGYTVALVLQETLAHADALDQESLKKAVFGLSGKLKTLDGTFELDEHGAQIGEITPLGQIHKDGKNVKLTVVYPHELATGQADLSGK
ncbi:MAG: ABC transporter substrate-binding protein [Proteobacteria bacterium]|nr:ABC transporter substrate-binding protein [Pseudomonadota bacterium]